MDLLQAREAYLLDLEGSRNKSDKTVTGYGRDLGFFIKTFGNKNIEAVTYRDIAGYFSALKSRKRLTVIAMEKDPKKRKMAPKGEKALYSIPFQNRLCSAVRGIFKYLQDTDAITANPAERLTYVKQDDAGEPTHLKPKEVEALLSAARRSGLRDYAMFSFFLYTGARIAEAARLKLQNIRGDEILIYGKGKKKRKIPLKESLREILKEYLEWRAQTEEKYGRPSEYLFITQKGGGLTTRAILKRFKKLLGAAGLSAAFHVHHLRHTFGTVVYNNTKDIRVTQDLLGHSSPTTTQIYAHTHRPDMKKAVESI
ncbi:MAG: tyrosine-type recombinase/integrase [Endomicrobiia bacterium]|nr:tyrosine-type recombinase/integrase [Endomicrobiia bacterium]